MNRNASLELVFGLKWFRIHPKGEESARGSQERPKSIQVIPPGGFGKLVANKNALPDETSKQLAHV